METFVLVFSSLAYNRLIIFTGCRRLGLTRMSGKVDRGNLDL